MHSLTQMWKKLELINEGVEVMSNEYKEMMKAATRDFLDGTLQQDSETGEYLNLGEVEEIYSDISIELDHVYAQAVKADEYEAKAKAYDAIEINIKALRKHMLNSGKSVNAKRIETENTLKHIEEIIEGVDSNDYLHKMHD